MTDLDLLAEGAHVVLELAGTRTNYRLQAVILGSDDLEVKLEIADGRKVRVPVTAIRHISAAPVPTILSPTTASQPLVGRAQADIARALTSIVKTSQVEPNAELRISTLRDELDTISPHITSALNRSHAQTILEAAGAVLVQIGHNDRIAGAVAHKNAMDAIQRARTTKRQRHSSNPLMNALSLVLEQLVNDQENHWNRIDTLTLRPPQIVTRDRVNVTRGSDHEFDLPVRVSLDNLSSELRDVTIVLDKYRNLKLIGGAPVISILRSGETTSVSIRLRDHRRQGARSEIRVDVHLSYRAPDGRTHTTPRQTLIVKIQGSEPHVDIPNPFRPYAGGLPVSKPEMFFGRDALIQELVRDLGRTPAGTCFAIYGQQRIGKSSVLEQVRKRLLEKQAIVASLSMGTIDRRSVTVDFVEEVLDQFRVQVDRVLPAESSRLLLDRWPDTSAIENRPLRSFQRALEAARTLLRAAGVSGVAFVVVVDEFTYIHEILRRRGVLPSEHNELKDFMRQLKGLLEARLFSALLIGQDTMPRFLESYPNEFSVMSTRKLDYLSSEETQLLADVPIRPRNGETRYSGYALSTIASYTDGHPFFTQVLCDRVISLVNSNRRSQITQSDVEEAVESLLAGRDCIEAHKFDCLITADNSHTLMSDLDSNEQPDGTERSLTVLRRIASLSGSQNMPVPIDDLQLDPRQVEALQDLVLRGVLHQGEQSVSIRVLLYADYLRRRQR